MSMEIKNLRSSSPTSNGPKSALAKTKFTCRQFITLLSFDPKIPTIYNEKTKNLIQAKRKPTSSIEIMNVEEEIGRLKEEIKRLGTLQSDGSYKVTFGVMFNDDRCANIFEALVGTLRAAKKRKLLTYDGELLLQGVHDNVEIILKAEATPSDGAATKS